MTVPRMMIAAIGCAMIAAPAVAQQAGAPTPAAQRGLAAFARCVVAASPEKSAETLAMDFTTREHRAGLRVLADANRSCLDRGRLAATGLPFAGALAGALLSAGQEPIRTALARGARATAPQAFSPTDAAAICAVRSIPDDVAGLLSTEAASIAEGEALKPIRPVYAKCAGGAKIETSDLGLRAMLSTAAFRVARAGAE